MNVGPAMGSELGNLVSAPLGLNEIGNKVGILVKGEARGATGSSLGSVEGITEGTLGAEVTGDSVGLVDASCGARVAGLSVGALTGIEVEGSAGLFSGT